MGRPTAGQYRNTLAICGPPESAPSPGTADRVWELTSPSLDVVAARLVGLSPEEQADIEMTARQAWAVTVATALRCGLDRAAFTGNRFFAALARVWSPSYRAALTRGARSVREMSSDTITIRVWPELLHQGVRAAALWKVATKGIPNVFRSTLQRPQRSGRGPRHRVYRIKLVDSARCRELIRLLRISRSRRLLLAEDHAPPSAIERTVLAEQAYDVMEVGDGANDVRQRLEAARLWLDLRAIRDDVRRERTAIRGHAWKKAYAAWKRSAQVRLAAKIQDPTRRRERMKRLYLQWLQADDQAALRLRNHYRTRRRRYQAALAVRREIRERQRAGDLAWDVPYVEIKSMFFVGTNRRWYARNVWVPQTRSKDVFAIASDSPVGDDMSFLRATQRGAWFRAMVPEERYELEEAAGEFDDLVPLFGVDVSSSMDHVIAILAAHRKDERRIVEDEETPKEARARRLWEASRVGGVRLAGFSGPDDSRLRACISELQNIRYGADIDNLARLLRNDPVQYGRGLGDSRNVRAALASIEEPYDALWLRVCQALGVSAIARDGCLRVVDPLDGTEFIWNPQRAVKRVISHQAFKLIVAEPRGLQAGKLTNRVSPGIIHMCDAAFAAEVVRALNERGVRHLAIVHDCFLIPQMGGEEVELLEDAVAAAGRPWFVRLEPVYALFERYLGDDADYGPIVRGWREAWQRRKECEDWPKFRVKRETTYGDSYEDDEDV